jgi:hypothetical protein
VLFAERIADSIIEGRAALKDKGQVTAMKNMMTEKIQMDRETLFGNAQSPSIIV